jgi:hypothetical protein
LSDKPPSRIADAPDENHVERPCDCPGGPDPQKAPDGEIFCKNCKVVLGYDDLAETAGLPPDVLRDIRRKKAELRKYEDYVAKKVQGFICTGTGKEGKGKNKDGKGCGKPVFWSGRGPAPKWCGECQDFNDNEKLKKWRHDNPEAWQEIRNRSTKKTSDRKKDAYRRGITEVSRREG